MGTLMASGWMQAGKVFKGKTEISYEEMPELFSAYLDGVANRGKAKVGDKTFLDGLSPAVDAMKRAVAEGKTPAETADLGAKAAEQGFHDTTDMVAVHGRAATRGEASRTLEDPGAAVAMLMMRAYKSWVDTQQ
jgi:dihydroxyacetone kinase-like protein